MLDNRIAHAWLSVKWPFGVATKGQKHTFWDSHSVVSDGVYCKDWKDCVVNIQDIEGMMRYEVDSMYTYINVYTYSL